MQAVARAERLFTVVLPARFIPGPRWTRPSLRLTPLAAPLVADAEVERFRRLVVGLFGFRRKQLGRGLRELTGWDAERVEAALALAGIDAAPGRRRSRPPGVRHAAPRAR